MTDNYLDLAAQSIVKGEQFRWETCKYCALGVGQYKDGFARDLAARTGVSASRISDYAQSGRADEALEPYMTEDERHSFKPDAFVLCDSLITKGKTADEVALVLKEILEENPRPTIVEAKEKLSGKFGLPHKEPDPMKHVTALETWGETNMQNPTDRAAWFATTRVQREWIKKARVVSP